MERRSHSETSTLFIYELPGPGVIVDRSIGYLQRHIEISAPNKRQKLGFQLIPLSLSHEILTINKQILTQKYERAEC